MTSQDALELMRGALRETIPNFDPDDVFNTVEDGVCFSTHLDITAVVRARYLAMAAVRGPDHLVHCPQHCVPNDREVWARCTKIPVRDALLGKSCS